MQWRPIRTHKLGLITFISWEFLAIILWESVEHGITLTIIIVLTFLKLEWHCTSCAVTLRYLESSVQDYF